MVTLKEDFGFSDSIDMSDFINKFICSGRDCRSGFWSQNVFNISVIFIKSIIVFRCNTLHRPRINFSCNSRIMDEWLLAADLWIFDCLILTNIVVHKFLHNLDVHFMIISLIKCSITESCKLATKVFLWFFQRKIRVR
jgi:hypothetical protein